MASACEDSDSIFKLAIRTYRDNFSGDPSIAAYAPGRVNLIGEHTDYNDGFVLPMALPMITVAVGSKVEGNHCKIATTSAHVDGMQKLFVLDLSSIEKELVPGNPSWANYVKGVMEHFKDRLCAFNVVIASSVPLGGGLSSSAALEVAMYTFLEALTEGSNANNMEDKARACQKAEHEFCGMPCGIMDQFISFLGKQDHALLLDCRSLQYEYVPILDEEVSILIINTNVRHQLSGSEYPLRRKQCEEACNVIGKNSLRDITLSELNADRSNMSEVVYNRAKHVITEIYRTIKSGEALRNNDYERFGEFMCQSHVSLRDDYEVSCPELDQVVDATMKCQGVYGTRMTGGGFGGCTVTLLKSSAVSNVIKHVKKTYQGNPDIYECRPSKGAGLLKLL